MVDVITKVLVDYEEIVQGTLDLRALTCGEAGTQTFDKIR
jgi:hypothetical protein